MFGAISRARFRPTVVNEMRSAIFAIAATALVACAGAPAKNPAPAKSAIVILPSRAPREPIGLVDVVPPKPVCVLVGKNETYDITIAPGVRDLLYVTSATTKLTIGENAEVFAELTTPSFVVRGFVSHHDKRVYPAKWLSIDGVYFLTNLTSYPIVAAHDGKMTLDVTGLSSVDFTDPNDHLVDVKCDDVTLTQEPSDELRNTLPPQLVGPGRSARFEWRGGIPISATFDGPPVLKTAMLHPGHYSPRFTTVLETRGKKVRIADRTHVAGWIDANLVSIVPADEMRTPAKIEVRTNVTSSHPPLSARCLPDEPVPDPIDARTLVCPRDVRLVVVADESPEQLNVMGKIPAGRPVRLLDRVGDLTTVFLGESPAISQHPLATSSHVHVSTPTIDLADCTPTNAFPFAAREPELQTQYAAEPGHDAILEMGDSAIPHFREQQAIRKILDEHSDFTLCYDEGLRSDRALWGEVVARFVVRPNGNVSNVTELASQIPLSSRRTTQCVLGSLASLRFPPPTSKTKTTTVTAYIKLQE